MCLEGLMAQVLKREHNYEPKNILGISKVTHDRFSSSNLISSRIHHLGEIQLLKLNRSCVSLYFSRMFFKNFLKTFTVYRLMLLQPIFINNFQLIQGQILVSFGKIQGRTLLLYYVIYFFPILFFPEESRQQGAQEIQLSTTASAGR